MEFHENVKMLPIWEIGGKGRFSPAMQYNVPFVYTAFQQRSDLGGCIISTFAPHLVCKLRSFRTHVTEVEGRDAMNAKNRDIADNQERLRIEYLEQRRIAFENGIEASRQGITVKELIEQQGRVYDEEFDEPRMVVKVPGLNVYLELFGCLDILDDEIDWNGEHGVYDTLEKMALWAQNIWDRKDRRPRATDKQDPQPLPEWNEDYNPMLYPTMYRKRGIGLTFIDPSRRPELLHSHAPAEDKDKHGMVRQLKQATADLAAQGIAPEDYGKR